MNKVRPDSSHKEYWRQKEEFADLFNAYLFDGRSVIQADELEELDTDATGIQEISGKYQSTKGARDVIRLAKIYHGVEYAILAVENQEGIHYAMPMRTMGYDHFSYHRQYKDKVAEYRVRGEQLTGDEFLSGIKKTDRFKPVITLVIYYGDHPWDGPKSLHDMLIIPEELKPFINDYKIYLVEMRQNNLKLHNQNNIDLFKIMSILYDLTKTSEESRMELENYQSNHMLDDMVVNAIESTLGKKIIADEKGERHVCTLLDRCRTEGKLEGKLEEKMELITRLLQKGKTVEEISDFCGYDLEEVRRIEEGILVKDV